MIYGYVILKTETETFGLSAWRTEDFGVCYGITKVRLFSNKKERNNAMNLEVKNKRADVDHILPLLQRKPKEN